MVQLLKRLRTYRPAKKSSSKSTLLVAVTWDHDELLALVARPQSNELELLHTLRLSVSSDETAKEACEQLAAQLRELKINRFDLVIGIPRSHVEMRTLQLPPASATELPAMVRNEMFRQITDLPEDSAIDYFAPDGETVEGMPLKVEAVAVRPECSPWIHALSDALGTKPSRILLRTQSLMTLFFRQVSSLPRRSLLLNLVGCTADLSVLSGRRVIFSRTVRAAADASGQVDLVYLADEIRRTLFVAPRDDSDDDGLELEHVYMFADLDRKSRFIEQLADELSGSVSLLDPLAGVRLATGTRPENTQQMAVLLGMAWEHATDHVELDLANPKRPPEPVRHGRKIAFYGVAATAAMLLIGSTLYSDVREARDEVADLSAQVTRTKNLLKRLDQKTVIVDAVQQWERNQVDWLNEFQRISSRLPAAEKAVVQRLTMTGGGDAGVLSMSLKVRDPAVLAETETGLRDDHHQVSSQRVSQADNGAAYACQFETTVVVRPAASVAPTAPGKTPATVPAPVAAR